MRRLMWELDYVQIELVVLAWMSGDKNMRQVYIDGADLHERTARGMHRVPPGTLVTSDQRDDGKRMNFGQVYGQGEVRCADMWNLPLEVVQGYFAGFNETYPGIKKFFEKIERIILAGKSVETPWFRRRSSKLTGNFKDDAHTILELKNFIIQSTAADITTCILSYVFDKLDETGLIKVCHPNNIVYDAIWGDIECDEKTYRYIDNLPPKADVDLPKKHPIRKTLRTLKLVMEDSSLLPFPFDLPITVDGKIGTSMSKDDMRKLVLAA